MFPLALLALAATAGYQYSKYKQKQKDKNSVGSAVTANPAEDKTASEKAQNVYNYYTNDSTNGTTLFNEQQEKKRTLFGN